MSRPVQYLYNVHTLISLPLNKSTSDKNWHTIFSPFSTAGKENKAAPFIFLPNIMRRKNYFIFKRACLYGKKVKKSHAFTYWLSYANFVAVIENSWPQWLIIWLMVFTYFADLKILVTVHFVSTTLFWRESSFIFLKDSVPPPCQDLKDYFYIFLLKIYLTL